MKEKTKEEKIKHFREFWEFISTFYPDMEVKEKFKNNIPPVLKQKLILVKTED